MIVGRTRAEVRAWRAEMARQGRRVGFVPTMGALHEGHLGLVRLALEHAHAAAASIFVNPTQFAAHEDLASYPRDEARDLALLEAAGCAFAYCPEPSEIYPPGDDTRVLVRGLSPILEGVPRPHFFEGVATVVARLFVHVAPDLAIFGEKDFQQLQIIRRMTRDLGFGIEILGGPTAREADGLAMSSRNVYLTQEQRGRAPALFQALEITRQAVEAGGSIAAAMTAGREHVLAAGFDAVDYMEVRVADTLVPFADDVAGAGVEGRVLAAARIGRTRLIDNVACKRPV